MKCEMVCRTLLHRGVKCEIPLVKITLHTFGAEGAPLRYAPFKAHRFRWLFTAEKNALRRSHWDGTQPRGVMSRVATFSATAARENRPTPIHAAGTIPLQTGCASRHGQKHTVRQTENHATAAFPGDCSRVQRRKEVSRR